MGSAIGLGTLFMVAQRSVRRYQKRLEEGQPPAEPCGPEGGPLPQSHRPLRLLSAVRGYLPRGKASKRALSAGSSGGSRKAGRGQANGGGGPAGPVTVSPRSPRSPPGWDLESQPSIGQSSIASMQPPVATGQSPQPAWQHQQQSPQVSPPPQQALPSARERSTHRHTALQAVDSIFSEGHAAVRWKSKLRQGVRSPEPGDG